MEKFNPRNDTLEFDMPMDVDVYNPFYTRLLRLDFLEIAVRNGVLIVIYFWQGRGTTIHYDLNQLDDPYTTFIIEWDSQNREVRLLDSNYDSLAFESIVVIPGRNPNQPTNSPNTSNI